MLRLLNVDDKHPWVLFVSHSSKKFHRKEDGNCGEAHSQKSACPVSQLSMSTLPCKTCFRADWSSYKDTADKDEEKETKFRQHVIDKCTRAAMGEK
jgi:hypothetical protein